jgi:hypothetical protein
MFVGLEGVAASADYKGEYPSGELPSACAATWGVFPRKTAPGLQPNHSRDLNCPGS